MKKISIAIMVLVVVLASCKKTPEVNLKYVDVERDLITVGTTTATVQCDYQYIATLKKAYLCYGEGENEDNFSSAEMRVVQNTLYVDLTGLKSNTLYSYYYEFHNGFNSMRSAAKTFKTEGGSGPSAILPTVVTADVTDITASSAKGGGEVTNDGGAEVTERGICWSTNANPTLNDHHVTAGTETGAFTAMMNGLEANTTYHIRAYATNEVGTAYGLDREFVTVGGGSGNVPEGAINGLFTINDRGDQVYFSQGNLQYQASTNTWRFAEHQWDYVGDGVCGTVYENGVKCDNCAISGTYDGWIDLFGWGTSGYNHGSICYLPSSTNDNNDNYWAYGSKTSNLYESSGQADWGYNQVSNGGNQEGFWRTLTGNSGELYYLFKLRNTSSGIRYAAACVNNVNGVVLFPDNWEESYFHFDNVNESTTSFLFSNNIITLEEWNTMIEPKGCVFFPRTGMRVANSVFWDEEGNYWSSSISNSPSEDDISVLFFYNSNLFPADGTYAQRCVGRAVRLVHDAVSQPTVFLPNVVTSDISNITSNSAICGGEVAIDGGATVTERGICWSVNATPTISDNHVAAGTGTGAFTALTSGLEANTTYHVRAYATNEVGTAYGLDREFVTSGGGSSDVPEGAINGLFSVSPTKKVYFSQGNLQYRASTNTWRFAENQWDFVGDAEFGTVYENGVKCNNELISSSYSGWIDLFGWGTSGWDCGNVYFHPYDNDGTDGSLYGPTGEYDLTGVYSKSDWGIYNVISNGGNSIVQWRTWTDEECLYLFNYRNTITGIRFVKGQIDNINGVILLPDNWSDSHYLLNNANDITTSFSDNSITTSTWFNSFQSYGAVFLPAAGQRRENVVLEMNILGGYWSTSYHTNSNYSAKGINFDDEYLCSFIDHRFRGGSVRLVYEANPQNKAK